MHLRSLLLTCLLATVSRVGAQVPQIINYQGRMSVAGVNFNGTGQFKFALLDASGTVLWSNAPVAAGQPNAAVALPVTNGIYSVFLGDSALPNMATIPASVFGGADVRLRIWFNNGTLGFQLLSPDQRIAAVGYAIVAGTVPDGAISSVKLADGSVTSGKLALGSVGTGQLANNAVDLSQLSQPLRDSINALTAWQDRTMPTITSAASATAADGNAFTFQVQATQNPLTYGVAGLPTGLSFDPGTHRILGRPDVDGTFLLTVTAGNDAGTRTQNFTLTIAPAIYADIASGNNSNPGTRAAPVQALTQAIGLASAASPKRAVRIAQGNYTLTSPLDLADGVSLIGRHRPSQNWTRSPGATTSMVNLTAGVGGHVCAVSVLNLTQDLLLDGLTIQAGNAGGNGASSCALRARGGSGILVLSNCTLIAGNGSSGVSGSAGLNGQNGNNAANVGTPTQTGGAGALAVGNGGSGGNGGDSPSGTGPGNAGQGGYVGGGNFSGIANGGLGGFSGTLPTAGENGADAHPIYPTYHGSASAGFGTLSSGLYLPPVAGPGSQGASGSGGAGGGAGVTVLSSGSLGGGGGGGGGGGEGGFGGTAGSSSGGSFGLLLQSARATLTTCTLTTANGASGGNGGAGGSGGNGGLGANGRGGVNSQSGAKGGNGGKAVGGGGGAGGAGGPSIGIVATSDSVLSEQGNSITSGVGGAGGSGGARGAGGDPSQAPSGPTGSSLARKLDLVP